MDRYDLGGDLRATVSEDVASPLNTAACDGSISLSGIICDLPAITLQDVAVQLDAAFLLADGMAAHKDGMTDDTSLDTDFERFKRAIASACRMLRSRPGAVAPGTMLDQPDSSFKLVWKGDLPPVSLA